MMFILYVSLQQKGSEIFSEKRNFTPSEYQQMFNEQLQIELNGAIKINSIEKFNEEDADVLLYVSSSQSL